MYPNNNQQITSPDYLNQIAPQAPKKINILNKRPILTIGIGAALLVIIIMAISALLSGGPKPTEQLAARLLSTQTTADSATGNIQNSRLRALNSQLKIYLTNTIRDITPILANQNIKISSLDKSVLATESDTNMLARLEDARLNVVYDTTYAREMAYQLDTVLNLMTEINSTTKSKSQKTFLADAINNLVPIQKDFSDFNENN